MCMRYSTTTPGDVPWCSGVTHLPVDPGNDGDLVGPEHDKVVKLVPLERVQPGADLGGLLQLGDVHLTRETGHPTQQADRERETDD